MKIAIPRERRKDEARVAASPDTAKRMVAMGLEVVVETDVPAGLLKFPPVKPKPKLPPR